jgi:UDP-N-acetylmuramyl-tripeptide synthetase
MAHAYADITHLQGTSATLDWLRQHGVAELTVDSRAVKAFGRVCFIAWPGAARDGRGFVAQALSDGACVCLVEADGLSNFDFDEATRARIAAVTNLKACCAEIAHAFYAEPSAALSVVAVTGTNGKTSTSWWTAQVLQALGQPCGVVGTLGVGQIKAGGIAYTGLTTPDPVTLQRALHVFVRQGLKAAAIEASSIGIEELRLHATHLAVAQFTNFTQDHLDYHGDMAAYWEAKRRLFDWPGLRAAVINLDDAKGAELSALAQARGLDIWGYCVDAAASANHLGHAVTARLRASDIQHMPGGVAFMVRECSRGEAVDQVRVTVPVIGGFNIANLLAVIGAARALGASLDKAAMACANLVPVPGRMQIVAMRAGQALELTAPTEPLVVVDYAHTPDALEKALLALRPVAQARGGQLWCVFGCGGDRDPVKRPAMGAMADMHADHVVLTSDNPRSEAPSFILAQILAGVPGRDEVAVLEDRREAIAYAVREADAKDVILLAGKGHETTQDVAGVKALFSDVDEAAAALVARGVAVGLVLPSHGGAA